MEHIPKCVGGGEGIDGLCELVAVAVVFRGVAVGGGDPVGPGGGGRGGGVADMILVVRAARVFCEIGTGGKSLESRVGGEVIIARSGIK